MRHAEIGAEYPAILFGTTGVPNGKLLDRPIDITPPAGGGLAGARDNHSSHAEVVQVGFHRGVAVTAISSDRGRDAADTAGWRVPAE
jgi:hypothetical protein